MGPEKTEDLIAQEEAKIKKIKEGTIVDKYRFYYEDQQQILYHKVLIKFYQEWPRDYVEQGEILTLSAAAWDEVGIE